MTSQVTYLPAAQDFLQFDGNAQMVRLVGRLQVLSDDNGLNLTFATLSAACKYVVSACDTVPGDSTTVRSRVSSRPSASLIEQVQAGDRAPAWRAIPSPTWWKRPTTS